jgi:hypothetical protein
MAEKLKARKAAAAAAEAAGLPPPPPPAAAAAAAAAAATAAAQQAGGAVGTQPQSVAERLKERRAREQAAAAAVAAEGVLPPPPPGSPQLLPAPPGRSSSSGARGRGGDGGSGGGGRQEGLDFKGTGRQEGYLKTKGAPGQKSGWQKHWCVLERSCGGGGGGGGGGGAGGEAAEVSALTFYRQEDARTMFSRLDADDSGALNEEEIKELCKSMGRKIAKADLEEAMREMDEDGGQGFPPPQSVCWHARGHLGLGVPVLVAD